MDPLLDIWYAVPLNPQDTTLLLRYRQDNFNVIDEIFGPLDTESRCSIYEITLRHPLYRTLNQEFALALSGNYLEDKTFLLGEPFSFYPEWKTGSLQSLLCVSYRNGFTGLSAK